jgi:hypothetical protein
MEEILQFLSIGGDIGVWIVALVAWKFDRRVHDLEMTVYNHIKQNELDHIRIGRAD